MPQTAPAPVDLLTDVLYEAMARADRHEPVGEATFAVLEAAVHLLSADRPELADQPQQRAALLSEALGSVRAAVVAAGVAVTRAHQVSRVPEPARVPEHRMARVPA